MTRIPLSQRLVQEDVATAMVRLILVQLPDFFAALARQSGDGYYSDVSYGIVRNTVEDLSFETVTGDLTVLDAIAAVVSLPSAERSSMLYHIMIEPFI